MNKQATINMVDTASFKNKKGKREHYVHGNDFSMKISFGDKINNM